MITPAGSYDANGGGSSCPSSDNSNSVSSTIAVVRARANAIASRCRSDADINHPVGFWKSTTSQAARGDDCLIVASSKGRSQPLGLIGTATTRQPLRRIESTEFGWVGLSVSTRSPIWAIARTAIDVAAKAPAVTMIWSGDVGRPRSS